MTSELETRVNSASHVMRIVIAIAVIALTAWMAFEWVQNGKPVPLFLILLIAGIGLPAFVELTARNYDRRALAVWTSAMMGSSMLAIAVEDRSIWFGLLGALFAIAGLVLTAWPAGKGMT